LKEERVAAARVLAGPPPDVPDGREALLRDLSDALYGSRICAYAQGFSLIGAASAAYDWNIDLAEIGRIWKGGCIIRARLLDPLRQAFSTAPVLPSALLAPALAEALMASQAAWRRTLSRAVAAGVPAPAHASALAYFDSYRSPRLPQNLTQAQRDAFGAHTYERIDQAGKHHSDW
jgi:6-phosphogluconate dehydrogenase